MTSHGAACRQRITPYWSGGSVAMTLPRLGARIPAFCRTIDILRVNDEILCGLGIAYSRGRQLRKERGDLQGEANECVDQRPKRSGFQYPLRGGPSSRPNRAGWRCTPGTLCRHEGSRQRNPHRSCSAVKNWISPKSSCRLFTALYTIAIILCGARPLRSLGTTTRRRSTSQSCETL